MAKPAIDIQALSTDERLELIGELCDSLDGAALPLTPEQSQELARRMTSLEQDGPVGSPWNEVEARIRARSR